MRGKSIVVVLVLVVLASSDGATVAAEPIEASIGLGMGFQYRRDFGGGGRASPFPQAAALVTFELDKGFVLRTGLRIGYFGLSQAPLPEDLQLTEHDVTIQGEIGLAFRGALIPSLSAGTGIVLRSIELAPSGSIGEGESGITRAETLGMIYVQAGLGIPMARGRVVLEPFFRWTWIARDDRVSWGLGIDVSVRVW